MKTKRERRRFEARTHDTPYAVKPEAFGFFFDMAASDPNEVRNGVALVHVCGPLEQRAGWFDGYDAIRERFEDALAERDASTVLLVIDSPGGEVAGLFDAVRAMRAAAAASGKRVVAFANEGAYSAAYVLATVASEVYLPASGGVGSCGVITSLVDVTRMNERIGVNVAVVTSGARKADGHPDVPLSDDAVAAIGERVNGLAAMLFDIVAESRPVEAADVEALQAACVYGEAAVDAGLADGVMSLDDVVAMLANEHKGATPANKETAMKSKAKGAAALMVMAAAATVNGMPIEAVEHAIPPKAEGGDGDEEKDEDEEPTEDGAETTTTTTTTTETTTAEDAGDDEGEGEDDEEKDDDEEASTPAAAAAPVPAVSPRATVASRDVLAYVRALTGKASLAEQLGALQALAENASKVAVLEARVAKSERAQARREVVALVDAATKAGKLTPSQREWAIATGLANRATLQGFLDTTSPKVATVTVGENDGNRAKAPKASLAAPVDALGLTAEESRMCATMGLDPADFAKTKAGITPKGTLAVPVH